jgi:hypothetical protein
MVLGEINTEGVAVSDPTSTQRRLGKEIVLVDLNT